MRSGAVKKSDAYVSQNPWIQRRLTVVQKSEKPARVAEKVQPDVDSGDDFEAFLNKYKITDIFA